MSSSSESVSSTNPTGLHFDIVVYGGTASAIAAAIQADRMGKRVAMVSPDVHLGGMVSSGLGWTDSKDGRAIGGLAREFHHRVWKHYRQPEAWTRTDRAEYQASVYAQPGKTVDDENEVMWTFEPRIAEAIFEAWLAETGVTVFRDEWLDRENGVETVDSRIRSIRTLSGATYTAKAFIDGTYEGDLMAAAGVTHRMGRDASSEFGEDLNGIHFAKTEKYREVYQNISPYVVPGDADSGLLQGLEGVMPAGERAGDADRRLQSFNFRLCLTSDPKNRLPIEKPAKYDEARYELLLRLYEVGHVTGFNHMPMPNEKTDCNNTGFFSLDYIGGNFSVNEGWNYSDASYEKRREIIQDHEEYTRGMLWTVMNHPRVPAEHRENWSRWGLSADEFTDNRNWPHQLYVREARRMWGQFVMTQHHVQRREGYEVPDSVGLGSYSLDSHQVRRVVVDGVIQPEGGFYIFSKVTYPISYGSIVPKRGEIANLLVPVTLSATHAAFGSIRMEPTYMILGQSAATASVIALDHECAVQDIPFGELSRRLIQDRQVLQPGEDWA